MMNSPLNPSVTPHVLAETRAAAVQIVAKEQALHIRHCFHLASEEQAKLDVSTGVCSSEDHHRKIHDTFEQLKVPICVDELFEKS